MSVTARPPRRPTQLALFQPRQPSPSWEVIPSEHRRQVEHLLARLLREYAVRRVGLVTVREVGHE